MLEGIYLFLHNKNERVGNAKNGKKKGCISRFFPIKVPKKYRKCRMFSTFVPYKGNHS